MFRSKYVLPTSILLLILIAFIGCQDDAPSPTAPGPYQLERPSSFPVIRFHIDYTTDPPGKFSFEVCWNASLGEKDENFTGYAVITYAADYGDSINPSYAVIDSVLLLGHIYSHTVTSIKPNKRYFSRVYTVSFGYILSAPLETSVYTTKELAPPQNVTVEMNFDNGYPEAVINWSPSPDDGSKDLGAYMAFTYIVTQSGEKYSMVEGSALGKKRSRRIKLPYKGQYYRTYIHSTHSYGYLDSPEIASCIYGYEILDSGKIDETNLAPEVKNAYGWNKNGAGSQYVFSSAIMDSIDICCVRKDGQLFLYSPSAIENAPAGARQTKFLKLEKDLWETVINLPSELTDDKVTISEGDVILLKNQDNYYVKLKIGSSAPYGSNPYSTIAFDYRFQTVQGLRAAKQ